MDRPATFEPADVDTSVAFAGLSLDIPVLAASMDAVVDVRSAGVLSGLGGLAVMNLEGVQMRYEDPAPVLERIATATPDEVQEVLSAAYEPPITEAIVAARIRELHEAGSPAAMARRFFSQRTRVLWGVKSYGTSASRPSSALPRASPAKNAAIRQGAAPRRTTPAT